MKPAGYIIPFVFASATIAVAEPSASRDLGYEVYTLSQTVAQNRAAIKEVEQDIRTLKTNNHGTSGNSSPAAPTQGSQDYTVKSGDNLWSIAKRFKVSIQDLRSVNNLSNGVIYTGQVLRIPGQAGNTPQPTPQPGKTVYHTVKSGDSLSRISKQYGASISSIVSANNLASRDRIPLGARLRIPGAATQSTNYDPYRPPVPNPQPSTTDGTYVVRSGDTLSRIARQYGVTVRAIQERNRISDPRSLRLGQRLVIPGRQVTADIQPVVRNLDPQPVINNSTRPIDESYLSYTFQRDDTLESVAQTFATTIGEIRRINKLPSNYRAKPGAQILVPTSGIFFDIASN